jgi:hypothetical protein
MAEFKFALDYTSPRNPRFWENCSLFSCDRLLPQNLYRTRECSAIGILLLLKSEFEPERSSPPKIPRIIVRQLAIREGTRSAVRELLWSNFEHQSKTANADGFDVPKLSARDCLRLILNITDLDPVIIAIDAVDEVQPHERFVLLEALGQIAAESASVVKIFVTTRNDTQIFATLPTAQKINITGKDTRKDMEIFIRRQVDDATRQKRLLNGNVSPSLSAKIHDFLLEGSGEMFLWVKLHLDFLC